MKTVNSKPCKVGVLETDSGLFLLFMKGAPQVHEQERTPTLQAQMVPERRCNGCPYQSVGFVCGNEKECMQTRVREIAQREKGEKIDGILHDSES